MDSTKEKSTPEEVKVEKQRAWEDVDEQLKFVCGRATVLCPFCSVLLGGMNITSNTVSLQKDFFATTGDKNGKINIDFSGACTHPAGKGSPCKAIITLDKWKNHSEVRINHHYALVLESTILCLISGVDIRIIHSGQMAILERIKALLLRRLIISPESNQIHAIHVCHKLEYHARYFEYGEEKKNDNIRWKVKIGEEEVKLEEETEIKTIMEFNPDQFQLTGENIKFLVPMAWRYKTIFLTAYVKNDKYVEEVTGMEILVKDHIVAAFYRVKNSNPIPLNVQNVIKPDGIDNPLGFPVHHLQGMYKDGNDFYFTGSSKSGGLAYIIVVKENSDGSFKCIDENFFKNKSNDKKSLFSQYTHPGGLQIANNKLVVGMEKYHNPLGFDTSTKGNDAMICVFDKSNQSNLITPLKDRASAAGIVARNNKWIIAVRKNNNDVEFYSFEENGSLSQIGKFQNVEGFQNLNLFLDEEENIYMFGMGTERRSDDTGLIAITSEDTCRLYKVIITEEENELKVSRLIALWIEEGDYMQYANYVHIDKNKVVFNCSRGASFHWSSCVHLQKSKDPGTKENREEDPNFIGNIDTGFLGQFSVYTSPPNVIEKDTTYSIPCIYFKEK